MLEYVTKLRKETDEAIDNIESSDNNILKNRWKPPMCLLKHLTA